jgi:uncharacterized protein (TIGR02145 family)
VNGISYGYPILIEEQVWLDTDISYYIEEVTRNIINVSVGEGPGAEGENSYFDATQACPSGWRLPTLSDLEALLEITGYTEEDRAAFMTSPTGFNTELNPEGEAFLISTELLADPNYAYGLKITENKVEITELSTQPSPHTYFSTRCMGTMPPLELPIPSSVVNFEDPYYIPPPGLTNVLESNWYVNGNLVSVESSFRFTFFQGGFYEIRLRLLLFGERETSAVNRDLFVGEALSFGEEEVMGGINFGLPMAIAQQGWLMEDLQTKCDLVTEELVSVARGQGPGVNGENAFDDVLNICPIGKKFPSLQDFEMLLYNSGATGEQRAQFLKYEEGFNAWVTQEGFADYISNQLVDQDHVYGLAITNHDAFIKVYNRWPVEGNYFGVRCTTKDRMIIPLVADKFVGFVNKEFEMTLKPDLVNKDIYYWTVNNTFVSDGLILRHTFENPGNQVIELKILSPDYVYISGIGMLQILIIPEYEKGFEEEIINDINYGRPVLIGRQVWLERDVEYYITEEGVRVSVRTGEGPGLNGDNSLDESLKACPNGWDVPDKKDFEELIRHIGVTPEERLEAILDPNGFGTVIDQNGEADFISMSSAGENNFVLTVTDDNVLLSTKPRTSSKQQPTYFSTRCIQSKYMDIDIRTNSTDYHKGDTIEYRVDHIANVVSVSWDFGNGIIAYSEVATEQILDSMKTPHLVTVEIELFGGYHIKNTKEIWIEPDTVFQEENTLDLEKLIIVNAKSNAYKDESVFFSAGTAPITADLEGGSFFVLWRNILTAQMGIFGINSEGTPNYLRDFTVEAGYPLDIATYYAGQELAYLGKNEDNDLFISIRSKEGRLHSTRILENTGSSEDLIFYSSEEEAITLLTDITSARLIGSRSRLGISFNHYDTANPVNPVNTVNTEIEAEEAHWNSFISINETLSDEALGSAEACSSSIASALLWDGEAYIAACLDSANMNIVLTRTLYHTNSQFIDPVLQKRNRLEYTTATVLKTPLLGHGELINARLGGIIMMQHGKYVLAYSTTKCQGEHENQIVLAFFDCDLIVSKLAVIGNGSKVNVLKIALYGTNLLVVYSEQNQVIDECFLDPRYKSLIIKPISYFIYFRHTGNEQTFIMMCDSEGNVVSGPHDLLKHGAKISASDDLKTLDEGHVVWSWVDDNNTLKVAILPTNF